jgi:hypothetical protein
MDKIIITFDTEDTPKFDISINDAPVKFQIDSNNLIIDHDVLFGLNLLEITLTQGSKVILTGLTLNGVSSRQTLYLSYYENPNTNSTWLTEQHKKLIIPFGNPMSWWLAECARKIPNTYYGSNLYETFDIFYSKSIDVDESFPKLLQDFMKYNLGFHVNKKDSPILHNKSLPWVKINLKYDEQQLFQEFYSNIKLLENNYYKPKQNQYNKKDPENLKLWEVAMAIHSNKDKAITEFQKQDLPCFFKLIEQIESMGVEIIHAFIGTVYPNSYVAPHSDDFYKNTILYEGTSGCSQFFIPIGWKDNNHFKFDNVGFLPYEHGAYLVNNSDFMHGSINNSDVVRFTIGIYCRFTEENIQTLIAL